MTNAADLDRDTILDGKNGSYSTNIAEAWQIRQPLGGYLSAISLRAVEKESTLPAPISYHCQFLNPATTGPAQVRVELIQRKRTMETFRVSLLQRQLPLLSALVRTALSRNGPSYQTAKPPTVPPPVALHTISDIFGEKTPSIYKSIETKFPDNGRAWLDWRIEDGPLVSSWHRFRDRCFGNAYLDAARLLILADLTPYRAAMSAAQIQPHEAMPASVDLTVWFPHIDSTDAWLLSTAETRSSQDDYYSSDIRIWDSASRLACSGTSIVVVRRHSQYKDQTKSALHSRGVSITNRFGEPTLESW